MSNFEHRIKEDSTEFEKAFLKIYDGSLWTALDKMKDWQPPKPLVVVPQIVSDAIESIPDYCSAYGAIEFIDMKLTESQLENEDWKYVYDWIFADGNADKFVKAWIDGYTVEKEKLYEIRIPLPNGNYASIDSKGYIWGELIPNKYKLTESEVKNIDERYWAFAVPV